MGKDADEMIGRQPKGSGKLAHVKVLLRMPLKGMTDGIDFFGIAGAEGSVRLHSVFEKGALLPRASWRFYRLLPVRLRCV